MRWTRRACCAGPEPGTDSDSDSDSNSDSDSDTGTDSDSDTGPDPDPDLGPNRNVKFPLVQGERFEALNTLPVALPATGFLCLGAARHEFERARPTCRPRCSAGAPRR